MKLYRICNAAVLGSGLTETSSRGLHSYTAILLIGLIATTSPDPLTPIAVTHVETSTALLLRRVNLSHDRSVIQESISSLLVGLLVPIPTLPLLAIRITSVGATLVVPFRLAKTIAHCVLPVVEVVRKPISAGAYLTVPLSELYQNPID